MAQLPRSGAPAATALALVALTLLAPSIACARALIEDMKLVASDGAQGAAFGSSVAISGDVAVIGAPGRSNGTLRFSGSAYVFRYDGTSWVEEAILAASDSIEGGFFGESVAVSGDTILASAKDVNDPSGVGSVYVFRRDGRSWVEEAKLTASDGATNDLFGRSVASLSDTALIGAPGDGDQGFQSGSAYVFRYDGRSWVEEAKLTGSDGAAGHGFGRAVAISGESALLAASGDGFGSGSVYVFRDHGTRWAEDAKLTASDGVVQDRFGSSVAISGDSALVGAKSDDNADGRFAGSAYVFHHDGTGWVEETKLMASDGAAGDAFGISVGISGDTAVVGAYLDEDNGYQSGSAYVFRFDGTRWTELAKLTASDGSPTGLFGARVGVFRDTVMVGAHADEPNGPFSGSAYVFFLPEPASNLLSSSAAAALAWLARRRSSRRPSVQTA